MTSPTSAAAATSPLSASTQSVRGRFLWHEIMAPDVDSALRFYSKVASWSTTSMASGEGRPPYSMFVNGEEPIAGVMPISDAGKAAGQTAAWLPYVGTNDVDATFAEARSLGATEMLPPTDIPTVGRIAVFTDPQGACIALYAPSTAPAEEVAPKNGEFSWHDLATTDTDAAIDFYGRLFGWTIMQSMDMGADGIYNIYGRDRFTYGGMFKRSPNMPASSWTSYIQVADLERACDAVRANGGTIVLGPHDVPGGDRIVMCTDNQGAAFALHGKGRGN